MTAQKNNIIKKMFGGWGKYYDQRKESDQIKKPFPNDFFLKPDDVAYYSKRPSECSIVINWAVSESVTAKDKFKTGIVEPYKEYPAVKWEDGLITIIFANESIPNTSKEQIEKLLILKEKGYDIPQKYENLIIETTGNSYVKEFFLLHNNEASHPILQVTSFTFKDNNDATIWVDYYNHDSCEVIGKTSYSFAKFFSLLKSNKMKQMEKAAIEAWNLSGTENDTIRKLFTTILSIFENSSTKESFETIKERVIPTADDDKITLLSWSVVKETMKDRISVIYTSERQNLTSELCITYTNCILYPTIIKIIASMIKSRQTKDTIGYFVQTFGRKFMDGFILYNKEGFYPKDDNICYNTLLVKSDKSLILFNQEDYKECPLVDISLRQLLENILYKGDEIIYSLCEALKGGERKITLHQKKEYLEKRLSFLLKESSQEQTLQSLWQDTLTYYNIIPIERISKTLEEQKAQENNEQAQSSPSQKEEPKSQEPSELQRLKEEYERVHQELLNKHKKEIQLKQEETAQAQHQAQESRALIEKLQAQLADKNKKIEYLSQARKEQDNSNHQEETSQDTSTTTPTVEVVKKKKKKKKRKKSKKSTEGTETSTSGENREYQEEQSHQQIASKKDPAPPQFIEVEEVPISRWNIPRLRQQEAYKLFGSLISRKLTKQLQDPTTPWIRKEIGSPQNYKGQSYEGINATILGLWMDEEEFTIPRFFTLEEIREHKLLVRVDARPMYVLNGDDAFKVYNIDQTNFSVNQKRLYETTFSNEVANNRLLKSNYETLNNVEKHDLKIENNAEVDYPIFSAKDKTVHIASMNEYGQTNDYYRDLSIILTEAIRNIDFEHLNFDDYIIEDLIAHLGSAMISHNCRFDANNPEFTHFWVEWLSSNPKFTETVLNRSKEASMMVIKE